MLMAQRRKAICFAGKINSDKEDYGMLIYVDGSAVKEGNRTECGRAVGQKIILS